MDHILSYHIYTFVCGQQQAELVSARDDQQQVVSLDDVQPFAGHIVFSCVVFWLCNPFFGLVAFMIAGQLIV